MDDVRALQDACLRDRQERDKWHHAFTAEHDKNKNLQMRLECEAEHAAKLLEAVAQHRKLQQSEVTAATSYQKTLLELTALQQTHLKVQQAHYSEVEALRKELDAAQRTAASLVSQLDAERSERAVQVSNLTTQLQQRHTAAAAEVALLRENCTAEVTTLREKCTAEVAALREKCTTEVAALHESYGGRLSLLEEFKNQLLVDKTAAEERWAKERTAMKSQIAESGATATAGAVSGSGGEAAWKARLMRLRAEVDAVRRERDAAHAALRTAGLTQLSPSAGIPVPLPAAGAVTNASPAPSPASVSVAGNDGGGSSGAASGAPAPCRLDASVPDVLPHRQAPVLVPQRPLGTSLLHSCGPGQQQQQQQHQYHYHPYQRALVPLPQQPQQQVHNLHLPGHRAVPSESQFPRGPLRGAGTGAGPLVGMCVGRGAAPRMALGPPLGSRLGPRGSESGAAAGSSVGASCLQQPQQPQPTQPQPP